MANKPNINQTSLSNFATESVGNIQDAGKNISAYLDPSALRKTKLGAAVFGAPSVSTPAPVKWVDTAPNGIQNSSNSKDWRLRVSVSTKSGIFYEAPNKASDTALLNPIKETGGVIFPITPALQITNTAKYSPVSLTHSNYAMQFYEGSDSSPIMINGEFPIQTIKEGQYLLAAIYFFRAATKMFWGGEGLAGTPPPMVFLDGYGDFYFPHVPCVVTNFTHSMPDAVDYIDVPISTPSGTYKGSTRLPLQSTLQVTLQPIYSRESLTKFNLQDFAKGNLITGGFI